MISVSLYSMFIYITIEESELGHIARVSKETIFLINMKVKVTMNYCRWFDMQN